MASNLMNDVAARPVPLAARGSAHDRAVLSTMSLGDAIDPALSGRLEEIARLPYVNSVLALPDVHQKAKMEVPSSLAISTRGVIVPEFTSPDVNDGMGVVITSLRAEDLTPSRIDRFFRHVCRHSAANFFDRNRYSLSVSDLLAAMREGAPGVLGRYGMDASVLDAFEGGGRVALNGGAHDAVRQAVPLQLLPTPFSRSEMGLNFGGNHFLEIQAVDRIEDQAVARRWGLEAGQVVVMYHLGPGPFSGTLLHHYSRRTKLRSERVPLFMLSKLLFHFLQRGGHGDWGRAWSLYFRQNGWTPFPVDSKEGELLRSAIALAMNFGYAYRLATVRAVMDGLGEAIDAGVRTRLLCDVAHNGIWEETHDGVPTWVARHNACRLETGKPTLVAGSYDVPSYLGIGGEGAQGRWHSYDHGAGNLIDHYRSAGALRPAAGEVVRLKMSRGRSAQVLSRREVPMSSAEPIERLMDGLERHDVMRRAVRLRPLGNLKN